MVFALRMAYCTRKIKLQAQNIKHAKGLKVKSKAITRPELSSDKLHRQ